MEVFLQLLINGIMLGSMYAVYLLFLKFGIHPYIAALPVVVLLFLIGVLIQRFIIQPLLNADEHIQIFATVGLSTALVNLALMVFGADLYSVNAPDVRRSLEFGSFRVLWNCIVKRNNVSC